MLLDILKLFAFGFLIPFGFILSYQLTTQRYTSGSTNDHLVPTSDGGYDIIKGSGPTGLHMPGELQGENLFSPSLMVGFVVFLYFIFCTLFHFDSLLNISLIVMSIVILIGVITSTICFIIFVVKYRREAESFISPFIIYIFFIGSSLYIAIWTLKSFVQ